MRNPNYFLNLEILHRIANGNTMSYMEERRLEEEAMRIEQENNSWIKENEDGK